MLFDKSRLGNVQRLGRLGEAAMVADGEDLPEMPDIHGVKGNLYRDLLCIPIKSGRLAQAFRKASGRNA